MRLISPVSGIFALLSLLIVVSLSATAQDWKEFFPDDPDPYTGDWVGRWTGDVTVDPDIAAQVIPLGKDLYRIRITAKLDMGAPPKAEITVSRSRNSLKFDEKGLYGEIRGGRFTGGSKGGDDTFELKKVERLSPTLGAEPPEDAIVLFGGTGFDAWKAPEGWVPVGDAMMVTPGGKDIVSKQQFKDAKMHVEFRLSYMPRARGQSRSNSGVFLQDIYEVQVLDSYGLEGYYDECGALYKVSAPRVNACRAPLVWQTYDIDYVSPKFDTAGELLAYPRMTVYHNGVLIQDDVELKQIPAWTEKERLGPHRSEPGPIRLQAHNNYVQYRNMWIVDTRR